MSDRLVRSAVERERQAEIAVGGGEVRIEVECALEFLDRLVGAPHREGHVAKREMRPWVAIVEFRRPRGERSPLRSLAAPSTSPAEHDAIPTA